MLPFFATVHDLPSIAKIGEPIRVRAAFTPYVGAGYTHYDVDFSGKWTHDISYYGWIDYQASFSNENEFTALAGLDADLGMGFKANIQGTFVSSTALTLGISYCF